MHFFLAEYYGERALSTHLELTCRLPTRCVQYSARAAQQMRALVLLRLLLIVLLTWATTADAVVDYDELCEQIVIHAQRAAQFHNGGLTEEAKAAIQDAVNAYQVAAAAAPDEPQAHLHAGTFFYNTRQFDKALEAWTLAQPLVADISSPAPSGGSWSAFLNGRLTAARIGKSAIAREAHYAAGQGNLSAALDAAIEQTRIAPRAPQFLFEAATIAAALRLVPAGRGRAEDPS